MKDFGDIVGWLVGILGTFSLANWGISRRADNLKFKTLFDRQQGFQERISKVEVRLEDIDSHFSHYLSEIKEQNKGMASDITSIKVAIAGIPKRKDD